MLEKYGLKQDEMVICRENMSAINISQNLAQRLSTKNIKIRHHFLRDLVEKKELAMQDIFTKALSIQQFEVLRSELGLCTLPQYVDGIHT